MVNATASFSPAGPIFSLENEDLWTTLFSEVPLNIQSEINRNLVVRSSKLTKLEKVLQKCDWKSSIFEEPKISYLLLSLFHLERIPDTVLATALTYVYLIDYYSREYVEPIPLSSVRALELITASMVNPAPHGDELTYEQLYELLGCMSQEHPSEQVLFLTPDYEGYRTTYGRTISQEIQCRLGFNFFGRVKGKRLYAPAAIYKSFLDLKFGKKERINIRYMFVMPSSMLMAQWQMQNFRIETIPAPRLPMSYYPHNLPVDSLLALNRDSTDHDRYHQYRSSCVFKEHRPFITAFAIQFKREFFRSKVGILAGKILLKLQDLELIFYPIAHRNSYNLQRDSTIFWVSLAHTVRYLAERHKERLKNPYHMFNYRRDLKVFIKCLSRTFALYRFEIENEFRIAVHFPIQEVHILSIPFFEKLAECIKEETKEIFPLPGDRRRLIERIITPWWQYKN